MTVNRLIILAVFTAILLLGTPLFNIGDVSAAVNPAPQKAKAWFYPMADPVPINPGDPTSLLTLWVVETKSTGIDYIDQIFVIQAEPDYPYVLTGAEVYAFDNDTNTWTLVSGTGTGDWQVTPQFFGGILVGYQIDWVGAPGTQLNNYTGAIGDVNAYEAIVVKLFVSGYADPAEALSGTTNSWRVSVRWDSGDSLDMFVDHIVDNQPPQVQLTSATQSLISALCISSLSFWFNVTATDNVAASGLNFTEYGAWVQNKSQVNVQWNPPVPAAPLRANFTNWDFDVMWWINATLKNNYLVGSTMGPWDFEPNSLSPPAPADTAALNGFVVAGDPTTPVLETTEGELGYIWLILGIFIEADLAPTGADPSDSNYTYFDLMLYDVQRGVFYANVNLASAIKVAGGGPATLGAAAPVLQSARLTFAVYALDGTLDYHKDWNWSDWNVAGGIAPLDDYNDTVAADVGALAKNWYNDAVFTWSATLDINKAPVAVFLNNLLVTPFTHSAPEPNPNPLAPHINYRTPFFNLTWIWWPGTGPDPTFNQWRVEIDRWNGTHWINVINETGTFPSAFSGQFEFLFDVINFGTGNYSIHIYLEDCSGWGYAGDGFTGLIPAGQHWRWEFNVTYFMVVFINNNPLSLWTLGPTAWEEFYQDEVIPIGIMTFGTKKDGSPLDWTQYEVNATITLQTGAPPALGTAAVFTITMTSPSATTPTYAWWNFTVDATADLGQVIGIYNVTASWMNVSASPVYQVDNNFNIPLPPPNEEATFVVKARIFLHFWVYDDLYSTGETATFFAHVASITWPAPGSDIAGALVAYDVYRDANNVPMATGFGVSNSQGFVVPSLFGEIVFGTEIGDDWAPGLYNVNATAYYNHSPGFWFDPTVPGWVTVYVISMDSATDQFEVWVFRDENVTEGFDDIFAALNGLSDDLSSLSASLNDVMDVLNNDVLPTLADIVDQLSGLSSTISDLNSAVADLQNAVADLQGTVSALSDIQASLDGISDDLNRIANDIADIKDALDSLQGAVSGVADAVANLADQVANVQDAIANLQNVLDNLAGTVSDIEGTVNDVKSAVDALSGAVSDLQDAVDAVADAVDGLKSDIQKGFTDMEGKLGEVEANVGDKVDQAAGDLNSMAMITMVLIIIALAVSALTAFKVFKS